jgi:hypothetical protein
MRLTLEPTERSPFGQSHPTITIEVPGDDRNMEEMVDDLIRPALLAFGFHPDTVYKSFPE